MASISRTPPTINRASKTQSLPSTMASRISDEAVRVVSDYALSSSPTNIRGYPSSPSYEYQPQPQYIVNEQPSQNYYPPPHNPYTPYGPSYRAPSPGKPSSKSSGKKSSSSSFAFIIFLLIALCCLSLSLVYVYYTDGLGMNFCIICCCFLVALLPLTLGETYLLYMTKSLGPLTWGLAALFLVCLSSSASYMIYNY